MTTTTNSTTGSANNISNLWTDFGLTEDQALILFSLQYYITLTDSNNPESRKPLQTPSACTRNNYFKQEWCIRYKKAAEEFLGTDLLIGEKDLQEAIDAQQSNSNTWKLLVLLECSLFHPYIALTDKEEDKNLFKGLSIAKNTQQEALNNIADWLHIERDQIAKFQKGYSSAYKKISGYWKTVGVSVGAGVMASMLVVATAGTSIIPLFAASGLYGAAAFTSGLAALGGGAIAAGGLGMTGGIAMLVGGGILLGSGTGASIGFAIASASPQNVINESAKLYVVMDEIIRLEQNGFKQIADIYSGIMEQIANLQIQVKELQKQQQKNDVEIKNLKKSIEYLQAFANATHKDLLQ